MRSSTTAKVIAVVLAILMLIPTAAYASSGETTAPKTQKTTMDEVKEYLYSEDYFTYKTEKDAAGWKDAAGSGITVKAAEGYERATDKQIVDHNITELKQLSRDFDIPIIAVSSLNRQSYSGKITMSAFKESGAIEYGSDVLIGLQLTGSGEKDFDADAAKEKDIRDIDLCILKNRTSKIYPDGFPMSFYAVFNCFVADSTDKKEPDGELDGFTELSKTDEDNIPFID